MGQKLCIFCQNSGLSKEHFWPNWLRDYLDTSPSDKHTTEVYSGEVNSKAELENKLERSGNLITKKFRVVCAKCNSGWMSKLEEKIKPIIVSVLKNQDITLNSDEILLFSKWIIMKVMVAEQNHQGTQVTPNSDLKSFYDTNEIPDYYRIYISKQRSSHHSGYQRHSCTLGLSKTGPLCDMGGMERNAHTVSFLLGPLFIYVIACREQNIFLWREFKLNHMKCVYPYKKKTLNLKSLKYLDNKRISDIAYGLEDLISKPRVK